ncbi:ribonuclease H-like domain-containing protein [Tanacetum coccineum]
MLQCQGKQGYAGSGARGNATGSGVNKNMGTNTANQEKIVHCYNCQGEGHMARQCTKPERPKNSEWFKEKMLLAQALEIGVALDEEHMTFLADDGLTIATGQDTQELTTTAIFQTDDVDAFDLDYNEVPSANADLMAKLSANDSDVLSEVLNLDTYQNNNEIDQSVQQIQYSEQPPFINESDIDITSDNNIISYDQYLKETENEIVNESLTAELERYKEQINFFRERQNFDLTDIEKYIDGQIRGVVVDRNAKFDSYQKEIQTLKLQLSANIISNKVLNNQMDVLKQEFSEKQDKYIEEIVNLEKKKKARDNIVYKMGQTVKTMHMLTKPQVFYDESHKTALGYQNPLYLTQDQRKQLALYCGHTIVMKHDALSVIDTEETLQLAEEIKLKMLAKQNDPIAKEKKVNIAPIDYDALNKLSEHFVKHFVPKKQLYAEQAFWLPILKPIFENQLAQPKSVQKDIPRELPLISMVKHSFLKMRIQLNDFDNIIKVRTKVTGENEGTRGFEHIRKAFEKDVIPFVKSLREYFTTFDQERKYFEIEKKELFIENDSLLEHIFCQDVMCIAMDADLDNKCVVPANDDNLAYAEIEQSIIDEYNRCVKLEAELSKKNDMAEKDDAPEFPEFLEINELKAQLRKKNTTISNLKDHIVTLKGTSVSDYTVQVNNSCVLALGMYKLDLEPLSPKHRKNREVHVDYLKQTKEHADTFRDIVEQARCNTPK